MKVHLRLVCVAGRTYRLVTLRPGTNAWFSTNFFHLAWHIVSDMRGAQVLARLMWGLAYQKQPGTMVLLHEPHLKPTPFDAARSDPVLLIPDGLTPCDEDDLRRLKEQLPRLGPPTQTIRWQTFGLDEQLAARQQGRETEMDQEVRLAFKSDHRDLQTRERMNRRGGFVCYTAGPLALRCQALHVARLSTKAGDHFSAMDYTFLAEGGPSRLGYFADGEVQIFHDYRQRVCAARLAREQVLGGPDAPTDPEEVENVVSQRRRVIQHGLGRKNRRRGG